MLTHTLDYDDTHAGGLVHATAPVMPVALAVGEETGATGQAIMLAALAGYEAVCRFGAAVPHGFHAHGLHATAACGPLAAALVAARLYGLSAGRTVDALGIAGSQAGGLLEFLNTGASTKQLHPGFAAHAGVLAARLARAGATGPDTVLEGEHGLYGALLGRPGTNPVRDLGRVWEVTRITIKPYPACQLLHAALDAARLARQQVARQDIGSVVAQVHPDAAALVCGPGKERPRTPYDAKFSLPWCVAAMLIDGEVTTETFRDIGRADVADLAARVATEIADLPCAAADQPGLLRVRRADGTELVTGVPRSTGGPDDPDLDALVRRKALANGLTAPAIEMILTLDELPGVAPLMEVLGS
ncbi:MmgE/PrpD family protein [Nonomuraea sp. NBC_01738]|nr:MmgE/PrpD family protein [Nonomuraea sp. NBC_01738]